MKNFTFTLSTDDVVVLEMALAEYERKTLERVEVANCQVDKEHFRDIVCSIIKLQNILK